MTTKKANKLTYEEVWKTLSTIDVNEYVKKKNKLSYLSWTYALKVMMDNYPNFEVKWHGEGAGLDGATQPLNNPDIFYYQGGTAMVACTVTIEETLSRSMWLSVMTGFKNTAVQHPDSRDIGDAKMRCLTKCFAMFGLGFYIYSGEDLPPSRKGPEQDPKKVSSKKSKVEPELEDPTVSSFDDLLEKTQALGRKLHAAGAELPNDLATSFKQARKTRDAELLDGLLAQLEKIVSKQRLEVNQPTEGDK